MSRLGDITARLFVRLRWLVLAGCIAGVAWTVLSLPAIHGEAGGSLSSLVPRNSPALRAERISAQRFVVPLLTRTMIVVRNPRGLSIRRQGALITLAYRLTTHKQAGFGSIRGALPLIDDFPSTGRGRGTTALLYLFFGSSASSYTRTRTAQQLVDRVIGHRSGEFEGVTGEIPGTVAEENLISSRLNWVELATVLVVALAIAVRFRSLPAAVLTILAVAGAYLVAEHVVGDLAQAAGFAVPSQAQPVLIVLVFGVTTDYSIFFLSRFRALLAQGYDRRAAAADSLRQTAPIVLTAGITVAAGTAALLVAKLAFIRGFGPALAIAVLAAVLVAVIFVPAAMAVVGPALYWPGGVRGHHAAEDDTQATTPPSSRRLVTARLASRHPWVALVLACAIVFGAASGLSRTAVANEIVEGLPASSGVHRAYATAQKGFAPGVLAPVLVLVSKAGVGHDTGALVRLQQTLAAQPGVSSVLGPAQPPQGTRIALWRTANAARYVLFWRTDPLGARAIAELRGLQHRLPTLLNGAGLTSAHALVGGDTALSADIVGSTLQSLARVVPTILGVIFLIIAVFLRALVAPVYLVLTSVLAAAAALGLTTYVVQGALGYGQTTYYAIFTVVVLLISMGSDYNVFLVGRIWQAGRRLSLRDAVGEAGARAAQPIATAAFVLACSFALLVIVPVRAFREIAFAMAAGLIIDAFVVRAVLVPALLVLVGPVSAWPGRALHARAAQRASVLGRGPAAAGGAGRESAPAAGTVAAAESPAPSDAGSGRPPPAVPAPARAAESVGPAGPVPAPEAAGPGDGSRESATAPGAVSRSAVTEPRRRWGSRRRRRRPPPVA